ncbi:MAG TPA: extracellular solute-binding protein [Acholeplasmataceae bacterium]|nr:extracellular solute-binding protein [Acholeplasmataceae bacterium]
MKKFLIIVLAAVALFFGYAIIDSIVLSFSGNYLKHNVGHFEEGSLEDLINSSQEDYYEYVMLHGMEYPENEFIKVDIIEDIVAIEGFELNPYYNFEGQEKAVLTDEEGSVTWSINIPTAGYYNIGINYYPIEGKSSSIERTILINGELPFAGATNVVFPRIWGSLGEVVQDIQGNDIRPTQVELPRWSESIVKDPTGYVDGNYAFYFEEGINTVTFKSEREPLLMGDLYIKSIEEALSYEEVLSKYETNGYKRITDNGMLIEAENYSYTTSPTLYALSDRNPATSPNNSPSLVKLNSIGGANWGTNGDAFVWNFTVEETGLYEISFRLKQRLATGMTSARNIYINGEIPFKELENYTFVHGDDWRMQTLGTEEEAYLFYFEAGENYEFKMESSLGLYGSRISRVESIINNLSSLYRDIIRYTGPEPDPNRDYDLLARIPNLIEIIEHELDNLKGIRKDLIDMSGSRSEKTGILDTIIFQLEDFIKKPSEIHRKLKAYNDNISSLGTLLILLGSQPLEVDYFVLHGSDYELPKPRVNVFASSWFSFRAFLATFTTDYSAVGVTNVDGANEKIEVWLTVGQDQTNILRKLIDEQFTPNNGIQVDLKLVSSAALLPATLSGRGPDVALGVGNNIPVDYALRNAVVDLSKFEDYPEVEARFHESAVVPYRINGGTFGVPEQQFFMMMFYRTDIFEEYGLKVPETWDDVIQVVIDLQKYNLEFYMPVPMTAGAAVTLAPNPVFSTMFYQNDGQFYINGDSESGFNEGKGPEVFERWTEFYTAYSFAVDANFANRFRSGQMPIGLAYYNTYNTLSVFAPEIRGKWDFLPVPGTLVYDEDGNPVIDPETNEQAIRRETVGTGTSAIILDQTDNEDASWEFLKWWTSTEVQIRFGREMEGILGAAARYPTANVEAMNSLPWRVDELKVLQEQWAWVRGIPEVPGSYMTGRHLDNALRLVINESANPRETIYDYVQQINDEIRKKRDEFGMD